MAAVGNHDRGLEYITRGEFQNHIETVIKPMMKGLRDLDRCVQENAKATHDAIAEVEKAVEPLLDEAEQRKETSRDNKLAWISIIASSISGIAVAVFSFLLLGK